MLDSYDKGIIFVIGGMGGVRDPTTGWMRAADHSRRFLDGIVTEKNPGSRGSRMRSVPAF